MIKMTHLILICRNYGAIKLIVPLIVTFFVVIQSGCAINALQILKDVEGVLISVERSKTLFKFSAYKSSKTQNQLKY
jgi:hypothetical protein